MAKVKIGKQPLILFLFCLLFVCFRIVPLLRICAHGLGAAILELLAGGQSSLGVTVGRVSNINATRPSSPVLRGVYPLLAITLPKISKFGAAHHYPAQESTASSFVATFPATNLLLFCCLVRRVAKIFPNSNENGMKYIKIVWTFEIH